MSSLFKLFPPDSQPLDQLMARKTTRKSPKKAAKKAPARRLTPRPKATLDPVGHANQLADYTTRHIREKNERLRAHRVTTQALIACRNALKALDGDDPQAAVAYVKEVEHFLDAIDARYKQHAEGDKEFAPTQTAGDVPDTDQG